jgi:putative SOS response-associated peptidase YedK
MCGRFRLKRPERLGEQFQAWDEIEAAPRVNIAPTEPVVTVRQEAGKLRRIKMMRWGLIPAASVDESVGNMMINARSETLTQRVSFAHLLDTNRCLIPADGFYEWQKAGKVRQPFCFEMVNQDLFAFAGLWDSWKNLQGKIIESCVILTGPPNSLLENFHDRMPVIIAPENYAEWINPEIKFEAVKHLLKPYEPSQMKEYPVSTEMNNAVNKKADLDVPVTIEAPAQTSLF